MNLTIHEKNVKFKKFLIILFFLCWSVYRKICIFKININNNCSRTLFKRGRLRMQKMYSKVKERQVKEQR